LPLQALEALPSLLPARLAFALTTFSSPVLPLSTRILKTATSYLVNAVSATPLPSSSFDHLQSPSPLGLLSTSTHSAFTVPV